jgi:hypothetical protein
MGYNMGYVYSTRQSHYDHNALTPLNDQSGANGTGNVNASDYIGYLAGFEASRIQNMVKGGVNWQQNDKWSFGVNGRYTVDQYPDSTLGVQAGHSRAINFDTAYNYAEAGVLSAYVSFQDRDRVMLSGGSGNGATDNATNYSALVAPTNVWRNVMTDADTTIGLNLTQKGLMQGKLELSGDVSLSVAESQYHTDVPYSTPACAATTSMTCGDTPIISYNTFSLKLNGKYQIDKKSKVLIAYQYQQLISSDYYYNALSYGYTPSTVLPSNQQSPDYSVNAVAVAYVYSF